MQEGTLQHLHSTRRLQSSFQHQSSPLHRHCHNKPVLLLAATQRYQSLLELPVWVTTVEISVRQSLLRQPACTYIMAPAAGVAIAALVTLQLYNEIT